MLIVTIGVVVVVVVADTLQAPQASELVMYQ
jgi:hypothetical protein